MNKVALVGRLTATPELKQTQSGVANTRFTVAVDRSYQKKGEEKKADFITCVAWRQTAEFVCKYFTKGRRIGVTGEIRTDSYVDQTGNSKFVQNVEVDNVEFVDSNNESGGAYARKETPSATVETIIDSAGDGEVDDSNSNLPF